MKLQGVTTTGIYCRATCKARPKAENVRPMPSAVAALAAGFRPCLLCRPDRLPGFAAEPPADEIAHALRLIAEGFLDDTTTDELARRIGYSTRHLVRLFEEHVGASPDFVARARRAHVARRLLDESDLPITKIAFAAGFSSLRQMNRVMHDLFGFPPTQLRKKRSRKDRLDPLDGGLRLRIPYRGRFAGPQLLDYLATRPLPGVETVEHGLYRRTMNTCGYPGVVDVRDPRDAKHVEITLHLATFGSIIEQVERVRALFRLDDDTSRAEKHLRRDPLLGALVRKCPGLRLLGAWDRFETAVRVVIGQQVSVSGANTVAGQLVARFGETIDTPLPGGLKYLFPSAEALAQARDADLSMPRARARTLRALASAVAAGDIDLSRVAPLEKNLEDLQSLPGVGPWTAHVIAGRVMNNADAFPASDLGLRRAAGRLLGRGSACSASEIETLSESWRPYRATAAAYLWMSEMLATKEPRKKRSRVR